MKSKLQNLKHQTPNTNHGITLVALIITIIVLLILAMVSIRLVMNGGIIDRAERGTQAYTESEIQEQIKLAYNEWQTARWDGTSGASASEFMQGRLRTALNDNGLTVTGENGTFTVELSSGKQYSFNASTGTTAKVKTIAEYPAATPGTATTENSKYTSNGKTAVIPAGYTVDATQNSIDNGLVISKAGNEWVWIPVSNEDFSAMFGTATDDGWTMSGTDVKTKYKSLGGRISDSNGSITRGNPGTTDWREPDVLNDDSYDKNTTNLSAAGLGANLSEMATNLKNDYKNMMDSIKKNGGFYVGRYELSNAGTKKNQPSLTDTNWYNLYAKCKTLGDESTTYSRMIWGCQWDQVCKFISTSGDQVSLTDSSTYGNYSNSQAPANTGNYEQGVKKNTGSNEAWKANNIYDLAGNCWELTQEAFSAGLRAYRGGYCGYNGVYNPVTGRNNLGPTNTGSNVSSRPTLYIK